MGAVDQGVWNRASGGDPLALTQAMITIPSVNPRLEAGGEGEGLLAAQCRGWLEGWGYRTELQEVAPGRWNAVARRGDGHPKLILNGHLDTVGVEGMDHPPFGGDVKSGRVWGRGACDMKGGLGILLATAAALARGRHDGELWVALTADEEHASLGMKSFVEEGAEADGAVVCEPTSLAVMPAHKGFLWLEATFHGRAAHGSRPEEGVDAILHAARFLTALDSLQARLEARARHPLLGSPSFHAGTIEGGTAPSVYPDRCRVALERRTLPSEDLQEVLAEFRECLDGLRGHVPGLDATLEVGLFRPGTEVPSDARVVSGLLDALESVGLPRRVEGMTAWVDAAFLNEAGIPAVCFGPGSIAQAHASQEWVAVEELERGAQVLTRFTRDFLAGKQVAEGG